MEEEENWTKGKKKDRKAVSRTCQKRKNGLSVYQKNEVTRHRQTGLAA